MNRNNNWVKVREQYPKSCKFILFYAEGEVRAGWMINLGNDFYDSCKRKWFYETEVSYWCDLPLPPMPEGE